MLYAICSILYKLNDEIIDFSGAQLTDEKSQIVNSLIKSKPILSHLKLFKNKITVAGCLFLKQSIQEKRTIRVIDFSWNMLSDEGCHVLGSIIPKLTSLTILLLASNKIRDSGCAAICAGLSQLNKVEKVDLSTNLIGFFGSLSIAEYIRTSTSLKDLNLFFNMLDNECAHILCSSLSDEISLDTLSLGLNKFGGAQREALKNATEKTEITF